MANHIAFRRAIIRVVSIPPTPPEGATFFTRLSRLPDGVVAAVIALLTIFLLLVLDPLANVPMNDDFSWARSAEAFARTGKIVYNGWGNPILLPHIIIGGLCVKLFGFSHVVLGGLGIASGALYAGATYLLARACGVRRTLALFVTALAVLNPVFLGCAPTFMSDIPSAFLYTVCLIALVKAARIPSGSTRHRLRPVPLAIATALALCAGANRQILWAALLAAFAAGWSHLDAPDRTRRLLPALAAIAVTAILLSAWFAAQPYSVIVSLEGAMQFLKTAPELLFWYPYKLLALIGLACLPVTLPLTVATWNRHPKPGADFAACLATGIIPFLVFLVTPTPAKEYWNGVWRLTPYGQYATFQGVMVGGPSGFEDRPWMMPPFVGTLLNLGGVIGIGLLLWCVLVTRTSRSFAGTVVLGGAFAQFILPLPWYASGALFDRYLVSLAPMLLIALLAPRADAGDAPTRAENDLRTFLIGVPIAALFAFGGVAFAVEYFGYTQARAKLYLSMIREGIPAQTIDAGVETCGDTQIAIGNYINNPNIKNPPDAYHQDQGGNCLFVPGFFPVMDARLLLSTKNPPPDVSGLITRSPIAVEPQPLNKEEYFSPIAPHVRVIYLYKVRTR